MSKRHLSYSAFPDPSEMLKKKLKTPSKSNSFFITDEKHSHEGFLWNSLYYIQNKKILISGGLEGKIHLWDADDSFKHLKSINVYSKSCIYSLNYIHEANHIVTSSNEFRPIMLIDVENAKKRVKLCNKFSDLQFFSFGSTCYNPKNNTLISGGFDKQIVVYDLGTKLIKSTHEVSECIGSIIFIEYLNVFVLGLWGGLAIFDSKKLKILQSKTKISHGYIMSMQYIKKYNVLITGSDDGKLCVWRIGVDKKLKLLRKIDLDQMGLQMKIRNINILDDRLIMLVGNKKYIFINFITGAIKKSPCDLNATDIIMYRPEMDGLIVADTQRGIYYLGAFKQLIRFEKVKKELEGCKSYEKSECKKNFIENEGVEK